MCLESDHRTHRSSHECRLQLGCWSTARHFAVGHLVATLLCPSRPFRISLPTLYDLGRRLPPTDFGTVCISDTMPKARQTCTQCSIRRQKCDRCVPCGRCQSRGVTHLCTRVWPTPEASRIHRRTSQQPRRNTPPIPGISHGAQQAPSSTDSLTPAIPQSRSEVQHRRSQEVSSGSPVLRTQIDIDDEAPGHGVQLDRTPEDMADGLEPYHDLPNSALGHQRIPSFGLESASPAPLPAGFPDIRETSIALLYLHIPDVTQIWYLVDYHEKYLLWYHGCYHGPTFRTELRDALKRHGGRISLDQLDLQWVALLLSVMAGSVACASADMLQSWGFGDADIATLPRQWYDATLTCLHLAGYTRKHSIYAVHAITTLSMSAHPLGFSEELTVLLGTALKIAQSLQLDRLDSKNDSEVVDETLSDMHRRTILQREIGRRLWSQLCVQDWFSLPSGGSLIRPDDFTTTKPSNRDHITMAHIDDTYPTYVSYGNYLNNIAKLMAEHHIAMIRVCTPYTRYEQVLLFDKKMRKLAKDIPGYFSVTTPIHPSWPVFIPWARRSLTICFAHKMIMIHRTFISASFTNSAFQMTRNTCIAAAKTILKEAQQDQDEDGPAICIDQVRAHQYQTITLHVRKLMSPGILRRSRHNPMPGRPAPQRRRPPGQPPQRARRGVHPEAARTTAQRHSRTGHTPTFRSAHRNGADSKTYECLAQTRAARRP